MESLAQGFQHNHAAPCGSQDPRQELPLMTAEELRMMVKSFGHAIECWNPWFQDPFSPGKLKHIAMRTNY